LAFRAQGVLVYGLKEGKEYWVVGKKSASIKGFLLVWERSRPPRLKMVERIKNRSLDELDELMVEFTRDYSGRAGGEGEGVSAEGAGVRSSRTGEVANWRKRDIREFCRAANNRAREGAVWSAASTGSGSVFVPSAASSG
jgi:hypothetical protein